MIFIIKYAKVKKLLLIFLLFVLSLGYDVDAQVQQQKEWTVVNPHDWGSFQWSVNRTVYSDVNGYFYYYVYAYTFAFKNFGVAYAACVIMLFISLILVFIRTRVTRNLAEV